MPALTRQVFVSIAVLLLFAAGQHGASAQDPYFTQGNLVVVVEGCGVYGIDRA